MLKPAYRPSHSDAYPYIKRKTALFKQSAYASFRYVTAELIYVEGCMANLYQQTILVVL
jgi:hypothetical protein